MKLSQFKFLIILFILAFFEVGLVSFDLVLVAVVSWAFFRSGREVLPEAFTAGLFVDLLGKYPLGTNAAILVLTTLFILTVKERFLAAKSLPSEPTFWLAIPFLLIPLVISIIIYQPLLVVFTGGSFVLSFNFNRLIFDLILAFLFYPVFSYLSLRWMTDEAVQLDFRKQI